MWRCGSGGEVGQRDVLRMSSGRVRVLGDAIVAVVVRMHTEQGRRFGRCGRLGLGGGREVGQRRRGGTVCFYSGRPMTDGGDRRDRPNACVRVGSEAGIL